MNLRYSQTVAQMGNKAISVTVVTTVRVHHEMSHLYYRGCTPRKYSRVQFL